MSPVVAVRGGGSPLLLYRRGWKPSQLPGCPLLFATQLLGSLVEVASSEPPKLIALRVRVDSVGVLVLLALQLPINSGTYHTSRK